MRRKGSCIALCLFLSLASAVGQEVDVTWGFLTNMSIVNKDFRAINLEANLGYRFAKDLFLVSKFETATALFNTNEGDKNYTTATAGVFLRYNIYQFNTGLLDIRGGWGASILKTDWSYLYYDGGVFLNVSNLAYKPTIGLGVRYYDSYKNTHKDDIKVYMSIGFTFN